MSYRYATKEVNSSRRASLALNRAGLSQGTTVVKVTACAIAPLVLALAALGGVGSFATVRDMAQPWFGGLAWIVPVGMDVGILILLAWDLLMEYVALPWPVLRWVAWSFIGGTVAVNVMAAHGDPAAVLMHAAMPVLFITVIDGIRHLIRQWVGLATGTRIERIPTARWLLAPVSTGLLWRRTVLWHVPTYRQALTLELQHLTAISQLQQQYGRWAWRWRAPLSERLELRRLPALAIGYGEDPDGGTSPCSDLPSPRLSTEPADVPGRSGQLDGIDGQAGDQGAARTGTEELPEIDAQLLRAAGSLIAEARRRGRLPSLVELGNQLRAQGFAISNGRLSELRTAASKHGTGEVADAPKVTQT